MQLVFSYPSGRTVAAGVLAVGADFIRVTAPRHKDGLDLYLCEEEWVTAAGKTIRIEAILLGDGTSSQRPCSETRPAGAKGSQRPVSRAPAS